MARARVVVAFALAVCVLHADFCAGAAYERKRRLNDDISHFEPLRLDIDRIRDAHARHRRSGGTVPMSVDFYAFERKFTLHLVPNRLHFEQAVFEAVYADGVPVPINLDKSQFLRGIVEGDKESEVVVSVMDGRLEGMVNAFGDSYRIESSHRYIREAHDFNAVMYRASDVDLSPLYKPGCLGGLEPPPVVGEDPQAMIADEALHSMLTPQYRPATRQRRTFNSKYSTCMMYLIAEHTFTQDTIAIMPNGGAGFTDSQKQAEVIRRLASFLSAADSIYRKTNFGGDSGYGLGISKMTVYFNNTPSVYTQTSVSEDYLRVFAQQSNFDAYCLAHIFSFREFDGGVLGLAYLSSTGKSGGICSKFGPVRLSGGTDTVMSLNTALVTTLNFGKRVSSVVTELTFAHEAGHNHGAKHDNDADVNCPNPNPDGGNFIMFAQATDGTKANNRLFSDCSRATMSQNYNAKAAVCFKPQTAACGDLIIGPTEACDCGGDASLCASIDPCCTANCTLAASAECSPKKTACCDDACHFRSTSVVCKTESDCTPEVKCSASNKNGCGPTNVTATLPDNTPCNCRDSVNRKDCPLVCDGGVCRKSFCQTLGLTDCQCLAPESRLCTLCCRVNGTCVSTFDMSPPKNITLSSSMGCNNNLGWCDASNMGVGGFPRCRLINPGNSGSIFGSDTLNNVKSWLKKNWYYVLAGVGGLVVLLILLKVTYRPKKTGESFGQRVRNSFRRNPKQTTSAPASAAASAAVMAAGQPLPYTAKNAEKYKESIAMEPVQYVEGPSDVDARRDACRELKRMFPTVEDAIIVSTLKSYQFDVRRAAMQLGEMGFKPVGGNGAANANAGETQYY